MAYTALLQAAPLPNCDAWGGGQQGGGSPVLSPGAGIVRGAAAGNIFYIKSRQVGQTLLCKPTVNINSFPDLLSHFLSHSLYKYCFTTFPFLSNTAVRSIFAVSISFDDNAELNVLQSMYLQSQTFAVIYQGQLVGGI